MKRLKTFLGIMKRTAAAFSDDNAFKLSASLSYYTIFALGPMLFLVITLTGFFYRRDAIEGSIYHQLQHLIGSNAALQVQDIIAHAGQETDSTTGAIIGIVMLFIGATGIFTEIQSSINYIWSVKAKPRRGWLKFIMNRLVSFLLVLALGLLLMASLLINTFLAVVNEEILSRFPNSQYLSLLNTLIMIAITTVLFAVIYKILPDATISWKDAWAGSLFTALLFMAGKILIGLYLKQTDIGVVYGAAASIVVILVWVYYSAMILYFGAEFTRMYAIHNGEGIRPKSTAVFIVKNEAREVPTSRLG